MRIKSLWTFHTILRPRVSSTASGETRIVDYYGRWTFAHVHDLVACSQVLKIFESFLFIYFHSAIEDFEVQSLKMPMDHEPAFYRLVSSCTGLKMLVIISVDTYSLRDVSLRQCYIIFQASLQVQYKYLCFFSGKYRLSTDFE